MNDDNYYKTLYFSHVEDATDGSGCELWTAAKNNIGYGFFRYDGKMQTAHRVRMQWEGFDVKGKTVSHTCSNYHCVNPNHLHVGTMHDKGQASSKRGTAGTHWIDPKYHKTCEHCGYTGSPAVIGRRHGNNCKHKP